MWNLTLKVRNLNYMRNSWKDTENWTFSLNHNHEKVLFWIFSLIFRQKPRFLFFICYLTFQIQMIFIRINYNLYVLSRVFMGKLDWKSKTVEWMLNFLKTLFNKSKKSSNKKEQKNSNAQTSRNFWFKHLSDFPCNFISWRR